MPFLRGSLPHLPLAFAGGSFFTCTFWNLAHHPVAAGSEPKASDERGSSWQVMARLKGKTPDASNKTRADRQPELHGDIGLLGQRAPTAHVADYSPRSMVRAEICKRRHPSLGYRSKQIKLETAWSCFAKTPRLRVSSTIG